MQIDEHEADVRAIEALVAQQFASLSWCRGNPADWDAFSRDFLPTATLYPSARPLKPQTVATFLERMRGLAEGKLGSFNETVLGTEVRIFGNVAVAVVACEVIENETELSRNVEMLLLLKEGGVWRIAAQAWDGEGDETPIPAALLSKAARA